MQSYDSQRQATLRHQYNKVYNKLTALFTFGSPDGYKYGKLILYTRCVKHLEGVHVVLDNNNYMFTKPGIEQKWLKNSPSTPRKLADEIGVLLKRIRCELKSKPLSYTPPDYISINDSNQLRETYTEIYDLIELHYWHTPYVTDGCRIVRTWPRRVERRGSIYDCVFTTSYITKITLYSYQIDIYTNNKCIMWNPEICCTCPESNIVFDGFKLLAALIPQMNIRIDLHGPTYIR